MCADTPADTETAVPDYKDTLNLPAPISRCARACPSASPEWLDRWEQIGVYDRLREKRRRQPRALHPA